MATQTIDKPEILFLSLALQPFLDDTYSSLIDDLTKRAQLKRAKTANGALRYLESSSPKAIIITDEGLTKNKNKSVLDKIIAYVRNGGLIVVGLHFPNFTNMDKFDTFFTHFSLPWIHGSYHRTNFQFNSSSNLPVDAAKTTMPEPFSMKVLHVKNAEPKQKIFIPVPEAMTQSHVFPPSHVDPSEAAVVGAKVGEGYVAYVGDVNGEEGSNRVILSLCGLADL